MRLFKTDYRGLAFRFPSNASHGVERCDHRLEVGNGATAEDVWARFEAMDAGERCRMLLPGHSVSARPVSKLTLSGKPA